MSRSASPLFRMKRCVCALVETISSRTARFIESAVAVDSTHLDVLLARKRVSLLLETKDASYDGQLIAFTLLNLLIRLGDYCPRLDVQLPAIPRHALLRLLPDGNLDDALLEYFAPFPAAARLHFHKAEPRGEADVLVNVAPAPVVGRLTVWSQGWLAYIDLAPRSESISGPPNPVGPSLAGALAAAEVFKRLVGEFPLRPGLKIRRTGPMVMSGYDYGLAEGPNPAIPEAIDVDGLVVVGLGGIGAAWAAAAASLEALEGKLFLVDPDWLDVTSHNRHLVSRPVDSGPKVRLAADALAFHPDVVPVELWFGEFLKQHGEHHQLVVVGVDKDVVRREIQASLPRVILNAGTSDDASLRVTRHDFVHGACLSCISRDDLLDHPAERQLAKQLGLSLDVVLEFAASNAPVPALVLRAGGVLKDDQISVLADRPLPEIQIRVCSELQLVAGAQQPAVSISFLSAIPGYLLLGEVIKERASRDRRPPLNLEINHAFMSTLGRPHPELLHGWLGKRDDCDCSRNAYQRSYQRRWNT